MNEPRQADLKNSNGVSVAASELSLRSEIAADAANAIEVDHIVKKYGDFTAVDDISFTVKEEEIFGLLGPNGAGKSTLIRMMTTLIPITGGAARIMGHDVARDPDAVRRTIGVIPQALTSDLDLTVEENMSIYAKLYDVPPKRRKEAIDELLETVDLTKWRGAQTKTLSGGMRRRVAIARAIITQPEILLYDSPTGGLDPVTSTTIVELIVKQRDVYKTSSLLVTHRLQDAFIMATHYFDRKANKMIPLETGARCEVPMAFLILREGKIIFDGDMDELAKSKDEYIKEYIS